MHDTSTPRDTLTCDIAVIGGGIIGLATALELAGRGLRVQVFERAHGPGAGASGAAAGIVSLIHPWEQPSALQVLAADSAARYPHWCQRLTAASGIDTGWRKTGMINFDCADEAAARTWCREHGAAFTKLDAQGIAALAPALHPPAQAAWHFPALGVVEPPRLLEALVATAMAQGIGLHWQADVARLLSCADGSVVGLEMVDGRVVHAAGVVAAAGAWSGSLLGTIGVEAPVRPVRGQILELQGPAGRLGPVVIHGHRYLLPRPDGRLVVGSTAEEVGFDAGTTLAAADALRGFSSELMPETAAWPLARHWAGLRPGSPDGIPIIGPAPGRPGLWLNLGHFRNGITLAPASAARLASEIVD